MLIVFDIHFADLWVSLWTQGTGRLATEDFVVKMRWYLWNRWWTCPELLWPLLFLFDVVGIHFEAYVFKSARKISWDQKYMRTESSTDLFNLASKSPMRMLYHSRSTSVRCWVGPSLLSASSTWLLISLSMLIIFLIGRLCTREWVELDIGTWMKYTEKTLIQQQLLRQRLSFRLFFR